MSNPWATVRASYVLQAKANAVSASSATYPPCPTPCPFTIVSVTRMVAVARPGATAETVMPRCCDAASAR